MTEERWNDLAIENLTEDEADGFWQAIAGMCARYGELKTDLRRIGHTT